MYNYIRHKVKQSKFAVMPVYRPRYTLNIILHSIFLLTLNCHLMHAFSMLSSILDSTSKTQDLILPCQLRSTLPNLRLRSNVQFSCKCLLILLTTVFTLWLTILLLCSGDIHPNSGPSSIASSLNSSTSHNHSNNSLRSLNLSHNRSFVHYNVQSILNKLDILEAELFEFDILAFTETWLNPSNKEHLILHGVGDPFLDSSCVIIVPSMVFVSSRNQRPRLLQDIFGCIIIGILASCVKRRLLLTGML